MDVARTNIRTYVGIAAADKANESRELYVYCPELLPFMQGDLKATDIDATISTKDGGSDYSGQIKTSNVLLCQYRCTSGNRLTPPDVRRGEQVIVTCYSDTNMFYWDTAGVDTGTRRTETYRIGVGDTLENTSVLNDVNSYYLELDTRRHQHIKLTTAKSNEEKYQYTIILSPERNELAITDDINNTFIIKSENKQVMMTNTNSSFINLEGDNITISCKGNIIMDAKEGAFNLHSKADMTFQTDANFIHEIAETASTTSGKAMKYETGDTYTCTSAVDMTVHSDATYSLSSSADMSLSTDANYSASSQGNMTLSTQGNMSISSQGTMDVMGQGNATFGSSASTTVSAGSGVSIAAGGGLSMSFTGSGTCKCAGGSMTMQMAQLNIVKG